MANFRLERLFIHLNEPIPGLEYLKAVDPAEFAWHMSNQWAEQLGVTPLDSFTYAPFERHRWHDPEDGLQTVRALLSLYNEWIANGVNPIGYSDEELEMKIAVLGNVQTVLQEASSLGKRFYLAARDLE